MDQTIQYKTLASYEKQIQELCIQNKHCTDSMCKKIHPRCFIGICIEGLQTKKDKCQNDNCKLKHFTMRDLKIEYKIDSINGIYRFNLCPQNNCVDKINCPFLHIKWAEQYCVPFLNDDCEKKQDHDKFKHIEWLELRDLIHKDTNLGEINPENLCLQPFDSCRCTLHLPKTVNVCQMFLKGLCPNLKCVKQHIFWEDFIKGLNSKEIIQNCIILHKKNPIPTGSEKIYINQEELLQIRRELQDSNKIDIVFIMDCTGSMASWITESSKQIYTLIRSFEKQIGRFIRVGFVGYRDFEDQQQFSIYDLTCDLEMIKQFISNLKIEGGGDEAEDVLGALKQVFKMNITSHKESVLITFLFADAPTHGNQYHQLKTGDNHPNQPVNSLENLMQRYYKIKEKNFFYCVKINDSTDKMFQVMKKNFPGLVVTEKQQSPQFPHIVSLSLTSIQTKLTHTKMTQRSCIVMEANYKKPKSIAQYQSQISKMDKLAYWKEFQTNILKSQCLRKGNTQLTIYTQRVIFQNKENEGTQCYVYEMKDKQNNRKVLAKVPKYVVDEYEQKKLIKLKEQIVELSDETIQRSKQDIHNRFEQLVIARQLAQIYRQKNKRYKRSPSYILCVTYNICIV